MTDEFCPRQISFELAGSPGVLVTATENGSGGIDFTVDVENSTKATGDLRALFFHFNELKLSGLQVSGGDGFLTEYKVAKNAVLDLGDGATLAGAVKKGFDIGLEWGTAGTKPDDLYQPLHFTLSRGAGDLNLDDIALQQFGAKLDSIGGPGGPRSGATKLLGTAPYAPDAKDDSINIFEDGAANLNSPSKLPQAVTLDVLGNDVDGDGQALTITALHEAPLHGTAVIAADGKSVLYTPTTDYAGTDSFEYCVSDGHGGQDSAVCTVNIAAVADDPVFSYSISQGANINEILIDVTATQNDADGSEFLDKIETSVTGGLPAGATVTPGSVDPGTTPNSIHQVFTVNTAAETDYNFDVTFTATSKETSNGDTETADKVQKIDIDFTHNADTLTYAVTDQSIWNTGDEFTFHREPFLGIDFGLSGSGGDPDVTHTDYDYALNVHTGFQAVIDFQAGDIDASIPVDVTVDTTYNKTTDKILVDPTLVLGAGGSFTAHGPEGEFKLDFVFHADGHALVEILGIDLINVAPFSYDKDQPIFDLDSNSAHFSWDVLPGVVQVDGEWPHITTTNDPGTLSGHGESQDFLSATLDIDQAANELLAHTLQFIDPEPLNDNNFEILDADLVGGLKMVQDFAIQLAGQSATLTLEDGAVVAFNFGTAFTIDNASSHDLNHDGHLGMTFGITPQLTLTNDTDIESDLSVDLWLLKNLPDELGGGSAYHDTFPISSGSFSVFNDTFDLAGVASQNYAVVA